MLFGYDQGVMGGFLTSLPFERTFPSISGPGNATMQGFTASYTLLSLNIFSSPMPPRDVLENQGLMLY